MKHLIKKILKEELNPINYYTTSGPMSMDDFIDIEVEERENYDLDDVNEWIEKYDIKSNDNIIWVALEPHIAARYQMNSGDWDNAKEVYDSNPHDFDVKVIDSSKGFLIPETDDGDEGFIFVFR